MAPQKVTAVPFVPAKAGAARPQETAEPKKRGRKPKDPNAPPPEPILKAAFGKQEMAQLELIAGRMKMTPKAAAQMCLDYLVSQARDASEAAGEDPQRWILSAWVGMKTAQLEREKEELHNMFTADLKEAAEMFSTPQ